MDLEKFENFKKDLTYLVDHSRYVSEQEFDEKMNNSISTFISEAKDKKKFYVLFYMTEKFGSEHWLIIKYIRKLREHFEIELVYNIDDYLKLEEGSNILIIDDAAFSGSHTFGMIDCDPKLYPNVISFNIFFVLGFCTENAKGLFLSYSDNITIIFSEQMKTIGEMCKEDNYTITTDLQSIYSPDYTEALCLIYFSHKIPQFLSSFTKLLTDFSKYPTSREKIEAAKNNLSEIFKLNFHIVDIMKRYDDYNELETLKRLFKEQNIVEMTKLSEKVFLNNADTRQKILYETGLMLQKPVDLFAAMKIKR